MGHIIPSRLFLGTYVCVYPHGRPGDEVQEEIEQLKNYQAKEITNPRNVPRSSRRNLVVVIAPDNAEASKDLTVRVVAPHPPCSRSAPLHILRKVGHMLQWCAEEEVVVVQPQWIVDCFRQRRVLTKKHNWGGWRIKIEIVQGVEPQAPSAARPGAPIFRGAPETSPLSTAPPSSSRPRPPRANRTIETSPLSTPPSSPVVRTRASALPTVNESEAEETHLRQPDTQSRFRASRTAAGTNSSSSLERPPQIDTGAPQRITVDLTADSDSEDEHALPTPEDSTSFPPTIRELKRRRSGDVNQPQRAAEAKRTTRHRVLPSPGPTPNVPNGPHSLSRTPSPAPARASPCASVRRDTGASGTPPRPTAPGPSRFPGAYCEPTPVPEGSPHSAESGSEEEDGDDGDASFDDDEADPRTASLSLGPESHIFRQAGVALTFSVLPQTGKSSVEHIIRAHGGEIVPLERALNIVVAPKKGERPSNLPRNVHPKSKFVYGDWLWDSMRGGERRDRDEYVVYDWA